MRVLVTRPERDALRTAERLKALGHEPVVDPVLVIEPVEFDLPEQAFDAVAITSANALAAAGALAPLRKLPLFAVGARSADVAKAARFERVTASLGDARELAKTLSESFPKGARVLYLAGENRAHDLAALVDPRIKVETKVIYRAVNARELTKNTIALIRGGKIDAILHYSLRSAEAFVALAGAKKLAVLLRGPKHLALSEAVAVPLREAGFAVSVASRPAEDALLSLLD